MEGVSLQLFVSHPITNGCTISALAGIIPVKMEGVSLQLFVSHPITSGCTISALAGIKPVKMEHVPLQLLALYHIPSQMAAQSPHWLGLDLSKWNIFHYHYLHCIPSHHK